jgi:hypothetical protein
MFRKPANKRRLGKRLGIRSCTPEKCLSDRWAGALAEWLHFDLPKWANKEATLIQNSSYR